MGGADQAVVSMILYMLFMDALGLITGITMRSRLMMVKSPKRRQCNGKNHQQNGRYDSVDMLCFSPQFQAKLLNSFYKAIQCRFSAFLVYYYYKKMMQ